MTVEKQKSDQTRRSMIGVRSIVAGLATLLLVGLFAARTNRQPSDWRVAPHRFVVDPAHRDSLLLSESVESGIDRATKYLVSSCLENGRFVYCRDLDRPRYESPDYNVLRHAGAIYALCQRQVWQPTEEVPPVVERAVRFLQDETFMRLPGRDDLLAVWSPPHLIRSHRRLEAKLGGTGLGLAALLGAESIHPALTQPEELTALGNFLIYMQRPDGGFYSKFIPSAGGRRGDWTSLYYPGEAALGLVRLYDFSKEDRFFDAALNALLYLAETRRGENEVPADHWSLLATAELFGLNHQQLTGLHKDQLTEHAAQVCRSILKQQQHSDKSPYTRGSFTVDGRTTPTATRIEGLMAALLFLPNEQASLRADCETASSAAVEFLLATQCRNGPFAGAIPRATGRIRPLWGKSTRDFNRRAGEIRVDYVQHAMSALIQYIRYDPDSTLEMGSVSGEPHDSHWRAAKCLRSHRVRSR